MKKTKIISISAVVVIICAVLLIVFGGKKAQESPTVDNTGANTVTAYNTETANYELSIDADKKIHDISDLLFGVFFEDINFAADGGLYAEMIVNRSFEFTELAVDDALYHWNKVGNADIEYRQDEIEEIFIEAERYLQTYKRTQ